MLVRTRILQMENVDGTIEEGRTKPKNLKKTSLLIRGLGMPPIARTAGGWPAVSGVVLSQLSGDPDGTYYRVEYV